MPVRVESNRPIVCFEMKGYFPHCDALVARRRLGAFPSQGGGRGCSRTHTLSLSMGSLLAYGEATWRKDVCLCRFPRDGEAPYLSVLGVASPIRRVSLLCTSSGIIVIVAIGQNIKKLCHFLSSTSRPSRASVPVWGVGFSVPVGIRWAGTNSAESLQGPEVLRPGPAIPTKTSTVVKCEY